MSTLRVDILTLFPDAFRGPLDVSMLKRARESGLLDVHFHDIREHATDSHRSVDDYPFGGGQGMVLRVDVLDRALQHVQSQGELAGHVVYLTPQGRILDDRLARELARRPRLVLVCGRYEGVDERFVEHCVDEEISIGDYVLTGGELPAMVLIDAVARHVPGVLGDEASPHDESFADGLLEHPQYTRPAEYRGWAVPEVLLGGNHAEIERWRREQRIERTRSRRPDRLPPGPEPSGEREKVGIPGIRVRPFAYPDDLPEVLELWRSAGFVLGPADEPTGIATVLERSPGLFLVAEERGTVVAAVLGGFDGRNGYVHRLAVADTHRRRGIGAALLRVLEGRLRDLGCRQVMAFLEVDSEEARTFLSEEGWQESAISVWTRDV